MYNKIVIWKMRRKLLLTTLIHSSSHGSKKKHKKNLEKTQEISIFQTFKLLSFITFIYIIFKRFYSYGGTMLAKERVTKKLMYVFTSIFIRKKR